MSFLPSKQLLGSHPYVHQIYPSMHSSIHSYIHLSIYLFLSFDLLINLSTSKNRNPFYLSLSVYIYSWIPFGNGIFLMNSFNNLFIYVCMYSISFGRECYINYPLLLKEQQSSRKGFFLPALDHPRDPAHLLVTGIQPTSI